MTYATVLLHLDAHPRMDERTDYAARFARRFESHLVGVAAADRSLFGLSVATGFAGTDKLSEAVEDCRAAALLRARHFRERIEALELKSFETVVDDSDEIDTLLRRSTCSDLLIVAQPDPAWPDSGRARSQFEQVVLHGVAPTLVLPHAGDFSAAGDRVMIAWDGSSGAAHAVVGALPLLQRARKVHLVRCDTAVDIDRGEEPSELDSPREWLGRHGVRIDAHLQATGTDVGDALLSRASEFAANMLVMGAWGHSRLAERLLGGVTRTILSRMSVPVLMAH